MVERKDSRSIDELLSELQVTPFTLVAVQKDSAGASTPEYSLGGSATYFQDKAFKFGEREPQPLFAINSEAKKCVASLDKFFAMKKGQLEYVLKSKNESRWELDAEPLAKMIESLRLEIGNTAGSVHAKMYSLPGQVDKFQAMTPDQPERSRLMNTIKDVVDRIQNQIVRVNQILKAYELLCTLTIQAPNIPGSQDFDSVETHQFDKSLADYKTYLLRVTRNPDVVGEEGFTADVFTLFTELQKVSPIETGTVVVPQTAAEVTRVLEYCKAMLSQIAVSHQPLLKQMMMTDLAEADTAGIIANAETYLASDAMKGIMPSK